MGQFKLKFIFEIKTQALYRKQNDMIRLYTIF
jgi:hypothetical protein